jgi:hypothetical protein
MATKTFDPNRVGGGTFELVQDPATGKYSYNKVGFQPLKSLTIPDLGAATTTTAATTTETKKDATDISKPFEQLTKQTGGGGGEGIDYTGQMLKEAKKINPQLQMTRDNLTSSFIGEERPTKTYSEQLAELQGASQKETVSDAQKMGQLSGVTKTPMGPGSSNPRAPGQGPLSTATQTVNLTDPNPGSSNPRAPGQGTLSTATETVTLTGPKPGAGDLRGFSKNRTTARPDRAMTQSETVSDDQKRESQLGIQQVQSTQPTVSDLQKQQSQLGVTTRVPDSIIAGQKGIDPEPTALKKVSTSLKSLTNSVGAVLMNGPVAQIARVIGKPVNESPSTVEFNKGYFNVRGGSVDGQRIAGNPATDLYAGFNRTSKFGNLEKAGARRLETRQKTIERKGYGPGDKFYDDTEKMKDQQRDYRSKKNNHNISSAKKKGVDTSKLNPNEMRNVAETGSPGGNGGGNGGGRVICTELNETGDLSTKDLIRDIKFTYKNLSKKHLKGYLTWAIPTVGHIKKYPKYRKIWKHVAQHRANDIAWRMKEGKFDLLGRIYAGIGEPLCWLIGNFVSDTNYNLLNNKRNRHL